MYSDEELKPTRLQTYIGFAKKIFAILLGLGIAGGVLYALFNSMTDSKTGVGAMYGVAEGIVFIICIWLGCMIGYFAGKTRRRDDI